MGTGESSGSRWDFISKSSESRYQGNENVPPKTPHARLSNTPLLAESSPTDPTTAAAHVRPLSKDQFPQRLAVGKAEGDVQIDDTSPTPKPPAQATPLPQPRISQPSPDPTPKKGNIPFAETAGTRSSSAVKERTVDSSRWNRSGGWEVGV